MLQTLPKGCTLFLPTEVLKGLIYEFVFHWDILRLSQVCRYWHNLTFTAPQWQTLFTLQFTNEIGTPVPMHRQFYVDYVATITDLRIRLASTEAALAASREESRQLAAVTTDLRDRLAATETELAAIRSENQQLAAMTEKFRDLLGDTYFE